MKKFVLTAVIALAVSSCMFAKPSEDDVFLKAMTLYNSKEYKNASAAFETFIKEFPSSRYKPSALMKIAEAEENVDKKKDIYERIIKEYPGTEYEAEAVYSLGRMYYAMAEDKKAEEYLGAVMGRFPNTVWIEPAYYYMILSLDGQGRQEEAKKLYADYNSGKGYYMYKNRIELAYANILFKQAKFGEAVFAYQNVIDKTEDTEKYIYLPDVYKKLAEAYRKSGNVEKAKDAESAMLKRFPSADLPEESVKAGAVTAVDTVTGTTPAEVKPTEIIEYFTVQVGAFSLEKNAELEKENLAKKGVKAEIVKDGNFYKLKTGKFRTKAEAESFARGKGLKNYLARKDF
jgi:TolA-binding protein